MCQISTGLDVWQVVRRFFTLGLGGKGDAWLLWDPSLDSGPNLTGACGRVDGIIETCKIVSIIRKYIRVPDGTRINKQQTNNLLNNNKTQSPV
jgi:hypothetical protein